MKLIKPSLYSINMQKITSYLLITIILINILPSPSPVSCQLDRNVRRLVARTYSNVSNLRRALLWVSKYFFLCHIILCYSILSTCVCSNICIRKSWSNPKWMKNESFHSDRIRIDHLLKFDPLPLFSNFFPPLFFFLSISLSFSVSLTHSLTLSCFFAFSLSLSSFSRNMFKFMWIYLLRIYFCG